jgi:hypothetical protein
MTSAADERGGRIFDDGVDSSKLAEFTLDKFYPIPVSVSALLLGLAVAASFLVSLSKYLRDSDRGSLAVCLIIAVTFLFILVLQAAARRSGYNPRIPNLPGRFAIYEKGILIPHTGRFFGWGEIDEIRLEHVFVTPAEDGNVDMRILKDGRELANVPTLVTHRNLGEAAALLRRHGGGGGIRVYRSFRLI